MQSDWRYKHRGNISFQGLSDETKHLLAVRQQNSSTSEGQVLQKPVKVIEDTTKFENEVLHFENISKINASIEKIMDNRHQQIKEISPTTAQHPNVFSRNSPMGNLKHRYKLSSYQSVGTPQYKQQQPILATFNEKRPQTNRSKISQISSQYIEYLKQGHTSPNRLNTPKKYTHSLSSHTVLNETKSTENLPTSKEDLAVEETLTMLRKHHDSHTPITPRQQVIPLKKEWIAKPTRNGSFVMAAKSQLTTDQKLKNVLAKNLDKGETLASASFGSMKELFTQPKIFNEDSPHCSDKENETPSFSTKNDRKKVPDTSVSKENYENLLSVLKKLQKTETNRPMQMSFDGSVFEIRRVRNEPKRSCECLNK